jgi:hypothetical protein
MLAHKRAKAQPATTPVGTSAVLDKFKDHSIVMLGEIHWNLAEHEFIQRLLSDARFPDVVDDVAVEFGNSRYQSLIDRYTSGDNVPMDSLSLAWRNTTQPLAWDPPMYAEVYAAVRRINVKRPRDHLMRLIALDPPIDWSEVRTPEDFPRIWGYRDPVWFETLEREVLSRKRRVLVIAGGHHVMRRDPPNFQPQSFDRIGLGDALAQRYPGQAFSIYPAVGTGALARLVEDKGLEALVDVAGSSIAKRSAEILWSGSVTMLRKVNGVTQPYSLTTKDYPTIGELIDGVMYFGPSSASALRPVSIYADSGYVSELRRRNALMISIFGVDQDSTILDLAKRARH